MEKLKMLREKTGAGMVDCKKALDESVGDLEKAVEILRKKGIAKAAKRTGRETAEGIIRLDLSDDKKEGYMVEVNAETDFVSRNEKFRSYADKLLELVKKNRPDTQEELMSLDMGEGSAQEVLDNLSGTIGEKMKVKRFAVLKSGGTVSAYSHLDGRIGVLVAVDKENENELAYDIAMQIAAANPGYIRPDEVPAEEIEKEKEIYIEQLKKEGKPENIIEKIVAGKLNKFYEEVCLLNQEYIKEDKKKIKDILGTVSVEKFIRFSL